MQNQSSNQNNERPLLLDAGLNFTLAAVVPVIFSFITSWIFSASMGKGYEETDSYKFVAYLIPQICFAGLALFFFRKNRGTVSARSVYRPCKWHYFLLAIALSFGLMAFSGLNGYFIDLLEKIGYQEPPSTVPTTKGWYLLPAILVIGMLPAVFEETIFRGIQLGSMQRSGWGTAAAIFSSGALFALFHGNPTQTVYQFICGVCYALLAVRSGSILPTMLAHFANNAVILSLDSAGYTDIPDNAKLPVYLVAGVVFLAVIIYLASFEKRGNMRGGTKGGSKYLLAALVGIVICLAEWIAQLLQGMGVI